MIALNYNILQDYSTISMTNEDGNFPVENIFSSILTLYAKTTGQSTVITITFSSDQSADMFALAFSNMDTASTIVCVYKNAGGATILTDNLAKTDYYIVKSYFASKLTTIRSIIITITNVSVASFYIGTIWIGEKILLPDFAAKHNNGYGDLAEAVQNPTGQTSGQIRGLLDSWTFKFQYIPTIAIYNTIRNYVNDIGQMPHFVDIFNELDDNIFFCKLTNQRLQAIFQNEIGFRWRDVELTYRECL